MVKVFRCEVDLYRNGMVYRSITNRLYGRNTEGVYYVGAKSPKEARIFLQKAIGFGSITVPKHQYIPEDIPDLVRGQICKVSRKSQEGKLVSYYDFDIPYATDRVT